MRPISNVVDVTNYVMLAVGNPLHAFDFDTLRGGKIVVRRARKGEEFTTLDGTPRKLDPEDLVIADAEGAIAFAGIMGGEDTEVREGTANVLLEAANFEPIGILRSSERHALRTEGSNRWEKGVDPHLAPQAAALATELILELTGAKWAGHVDVKGALPDPPGGRARDGALPGVEGREMGRPRRREGGAPRPAGRFAPHRPGQPRGRAGDPARRSARRARTAWVRGELRLEGHRPDLARRRCHEGDRPRRGSGTRSRPGEDPLHAAFAERDVRHPRS